MHVLVLPNEEINGTNPKASLLDEPSEALDYRDPNLKSSRTAIALHYAKNEDPQLPRRTRSADIQINTGVGQEIHHAVRALNPTPPRCASLTETTKTTPVVCYPKRSWRSQFPPG
ncbi:unnamed protein product [Vicia faba]|uniref:Uncharacterized protein n=1 Tax=Vicia faba TaxID=3906 RepID=A0AAV0Z234_VICFA|nr:unnamed protein product [Vicia faba]